MVELAVRRDSTAMPKIVGVSGKAETPGTKLRASDMGWPGMMSIRLHELDGMYDHPSLPMAGDHYQLLELQCHSKLAGRRIQRPKKGAKGDALEENVDATPAQRYVLCSVTSTKLGQFDCGLVSYICRAIHFELSEHCISYFLSVGRTLAHFQVLHPLFCME